LREPLSCARFGGVVAQGSWQVAPKYGGGKA